MDNFLREITRLNGTVNEFIWGRVGLILLLGTGILMTAVTRCFQITCLGHWWKETIGSVFQKDGSTTKKTDKKSISQFQALCTALAATIGTGNIAGVAAAIVTGGPGAVFWMWVAAFFGMMTNFSENVLGIFYRRKNRQSEWSGGAMYYLKDGLGAKKGCQALGSVLAVLFSCFVILASFGIGNMAQINKIVLNLKSLFVTGDTEVTIGEFSMISLVIGFILMIAAGMIIIGGIQRIAAVAERIVPFMAVMYIVGTFMVAIANFDRLGRMFASVFRFAFGVKAMGGAAAGITAKQVIVQGCRRGIFSNEAGLGSSVMVHSSSNVTEPVQQGMWGIFQVFFDTFVVCTMTAIVVLSSGYIDLSTGLAAEGIDDATLVAQAFGNIFGKEGEIFIALAILLFAFTTVLGWSQYGTRAVEYLLGEKAANVYRVIYTAMIIAGAVMTSSLAWDISDTFNGFMMIPNLIGVIALCPQVKHITENYAARRLYGRKITPMLSFDSRLQEDLISDHFL